MQEKYSVLMSIYYKENPLYFEESIKSILNQTVKTNDFVLIEDGKLTKELEEVVTKYEKKFPNIFNIIRLEKNIGLGPALAIGIKKCKNELIARMDSDDISVPDRCEKELLTFSYDQSLDMVGSNIIEFTNDITNVQSYRVLPESDWEIKKYMRRRNPFGHPSVMFKKSKVLEAGNYRPYYLCEDYDMWIRMAKIGAKFYNIQENLVYMRIGDDFYKRRGGIKYLKSILKFKREQYKNGFYSFKDFAITATSSIIICLIPNGLRDLFYKKFLRKGKKYEKEKNRSNNIT